MSYTYIADSFPWGFGWRKVEPLTVCLLECACFATLHGHLNELLVLITTLSHVHVH